MNTSQSISTMTDQHPITPPSELVQEWVGEIWHERTPVQVAASDLHIARAAADWQLEQVIKWIIDCRDYDLFYIKDRALMRRELKKAMRPTTTQEDN